MTQLSRGGEEKPPPGYLHLSADLEMLAVTGTYTFSVVMHYVAVNDIFLISFTVIQIRRACNENACASHNGITGKLIMKCH